MAYREGSSAIKSRAGCATRTLTHRVAACGVDSAAVRLVVFDCAVDVFDDLGRLA